MKQTTDPLAKSRVGGGNNITEIIHDHTLTGTGTQASPLSVLPLQYDNGYIVFQVEDYSELRILVSVMRFDSMSSTISTLYCIMSSTVLFRDVDVSVKTCIH